jgi:hypothetical protein
VSDLHYSQLKTVPEEALAISGADRFSCRGGTLPTTRDIYEPIVHHLGVSGGIVKHGAATMTPHAMAVGRGGGGGHVGVVHGGHGFGHGGGHGYNRYGRSYGYGYGLY